MNGVLNNIFDEESMAAIRNADKISPSPETLQARQPEEVEYQEVRAEPTSSEVNYDIDKVERILIENRDLKIKVEAQKELIHKIILSQNQMIKEINKMQSKLAEYEKYAASAPISSTSAPVKETPKQEPPKPEQQTSAGNGLNVEDFCVENIFYMGK